MRGMEREKDRKRGTVMAFNGGGSKRRPRSGRSRDSPEEEGGVKIVEKKMRLPDEVRSSHEKKKDGAESSDGSFGEEGEYEKEEEEDGCDVSIRRSVYSQNFKIHPQKQRNSLSDKIAIPAVPRKSRSASKKRISKEWSESIHIKNSRKKMKSMNGPKQPKPQPKISKQPSFIEDELEVAEFLFGLTKHFNQETNANNNEHKPRENSNSNSNPSSLPTNVTAQKKKRPSIMKSKEENTSLPSTSKAERDELEKNNPDPSLKNGFQSITTQMQSQNESTNGSRPTMERREKHFFPFSLNTDRNSNKRDHQSTSKTEGESSTHEKKFSINLMRGGMEKKARGPESETVSKSSSEKGAPASQADLLCKERFLNAEFDSEKTENNVSFGGFRNRALPPPAQEAHQPKASSSGGGKAESRQDKDKAGPPQNLPMPMGMGAWPGNLPPIGFMGQVPLPLPPSMLPVSGNPTSNNLQARGPRGPPLHRPKRCLTHCYLAKLVDYHQKLLKMNPYAGGPPGGVPRPPQFNLGFMPPSADPSVLHMQGNYSENKPSSSSANNLSESQRKQIPPQSGPMPNMMHGPAFMFPMNQQQAAAAMAAAMSFTSNRPPSTLPTTSSPPGSLQQRPMNLTMPGLPTVDPQIINALKNGTYPFPVPGPTGMPQSYRGAPHQSMPWSFYPPQMPPHQQLRPNMGPQQPPVQKSNSSSSHKLQEVGSNQVKPQDGDNRDKGSNSNFTSQVQKNMYNTQNYAMPFAFNAPRPAPPLSQGKNEEYKQKDGKEGEKNTTSASSKVQTVNHSNKSPNATSSVGSPSSIKQQMLIQLQKHQQQLMQDRQMLTSRAKIPPPGSERNSSINTNKTSDFSQVIKTAFPHAIIKRMESPAPSTSKNNGPQINPQNRSLVGGTNALKTVQVGSKQPALPSTSNIPKSNNNNNNTGGSPKQGSLTKSSMTPPHQPKNISPSVSTPRPPSLHKNPNNISPPTHYPNPNPLAKQNQQNGLAKDPKQQVYPPRPQFFYANPQQMQPYANGPQKRPEHNPVPAGSTVHRVQGPSSVGPTQPMTGGAHARVPVSFAYLPMVPPVSASNKAASDQKQGSGN